MLQVVCEVVLQSVCSSGYNCTGYTGGICFTLFVVVKKIVLIVLEGLL